MAYLIIECMDTEINSGAVWSVLDNKCEEALRADETFVAVLLRPEMQSGTLLVSWVEKWLEEFRNKGKTFIVITDDPQQIDSLEFSDPGKNIVFVNSVKEFEQVVQRAEPVKAEEPAIQFTPAVSESKPAPVSTPSFTEQDKKQAVISAGETITIAGEYMCLHCGYSRMWLKGQKVTECQNPECFEPSKGWKLEYDLF